MANILTKHKYNCWLIMSVVSSKNKVEYMYMQTSPTGGKHSSVNDTGEKEYTYIIKMGIKI